jgi:N,N'-diacetyllegionaminate synthase
MHVNSFAIGNQKVGAGRCFIIGEVALSHDGSLGMAHAYVDAIAKAGADAVKFQTHIAEAESSPQEPWRVKFSPQDESRFDYWKRMEFTPEQWAGLKAHAEEKRLVFMSSPFSMQAADLLDKLGMDAWKVASGEINNPALIKRMAATGKPVLLSSGMSPLEELDQAVEVVRGSGVPLAVMQCTSSYPTPPERIGLNLLAEYRDRYACPVGLSDHSGGIYAGLAAVTLGASLLEVHVTMSREMFGPDVIASISTAELKQLTDGSRFIECAQQNPVDKNAEAVKLGGLRAIFMKSLFLAQDLDAGVEIQEHHLVAKKPGTGIPAERVGEVLGKRLLASRKKGWMLCLEDWEH